MKNIIYWIKGSFEIDGGASARKLSAFTVILLIVIAHIKWFKNSLIANDFSLLPEVLAIDFGYIAAALGMKTYESVQKMKNENKTPPQNG